jgi:hypothetical protein
MSVISSRSRSRSSSFDSDYWREVDKKVEEDAKEKRKAQDKKRLGYAKRKYIFEQSKSNKVIKKDLLGIVKKMYLSNSEKEEEERLQEKFTLQRNMCEWNARQARNAGKLEEEELAKKNFYKEMGGRRESKIRNLLWQIENDAITEESLYNKIVDNQLEECNRIAEIQIKLEDEGNFEGNFDNIPIKEEEVLEII